jgi:hypothetical protein
MPVTVENLTNRPVLLRLNSGQTLHLAPRTTSGEILDVEVKSNAKVQKLQDRRVIALHKVEEKKRSTRGPRKKKAESTKEEK